MTSIKYFLSALIAICSSSASGQSLDEPTSEIPASIVKQLRAAGVPDKAFSAAIMELPESPATTINGPMAWGYQPNLALQPASIMKPLIAIAALEQLGPNYRAKVELIAAKPIDGPRLTGNLTLKGGFHPDFDLKAFEQLLLQLRKAGIELIQGDLLIDRTALSPTRPDLGLTPFDGAPEFRYNYVPDALSLNMNLLPIELRSNSQAMSVRVVLPGIPGIASQFPKDPAQIKGTGLARLRFDNQMRLVDKYCNSWEKGWNVSQETPIDNSTQGFDPNATLVVKLTGDFARNCVVEAELNILDRTHYIDRVFRAYWSAMGGKFTGSVRELDSNTQVKSLSGPSPTTVATHFSRPLAEFIREVNKRSDNPMTRLLFLTLGEHQRTLDPNASTDQPTVQLAQNAIISWMKKKGIDPTGVVLENGSGLSRTEKISAQQLAQVFAAAYKSPWAAEFQASLPIVGLDGSMRNRLKNGPAFQNGRIKTGGLRNVSSVAGYVRDQTGKNYAVVGIINDDAKGSGAPARRVLDALIEWVASGRPAN